MKLTVTLLELLVTHLKHEWLLRARLATAKPQLTIATLTLHSDHVYDRKVVPVTHATAEQLPVLLQQTKLNITSTTD